MVIVKVHKLDPNIKDSAYAHDGDAGFDLFAREQVTLAPGERKIIPTGIALEIPDGYVGLIWDKSGLSMKFGLKNLGGVVDASFRGEVNVGLVNLSDKTHTFEKNDKTAQMLIQKIERATIELVEDEAALTKTTRGKGNFGSTGK